MARPTKYTPEIEKKICDALAEGCTRKAAYGFVGVSANTFAEWLERFPTFLTSVTCAEAEAEAKFTKSLWKAATGYDSDWRAAESWLKRRRRDEWGDSLNFTSKSDTDLLNEAAEILKRAGGADSAGSGDTIGSDAPGS